MVVLTTLAPTSECRVCEGVPRRTTCYFQVDESIMYSSVIHRMWEVRRFAPVCRTVHARWIVTGSRISKSPVAQTYDACFQERT
ncbi:hypothetical protein KCU95_g112, partial [Aureobasidium melanogenum]